MATEKQESETGEVSRISCGSYVISFVDKGNGQFEARYTETNSDANKHNDISSGSTAITDIKQPGEDKDSTSTIVKSDGKQKTARKRQRLSGSMNVRKRNKQQVGKTECESGVNIKNESVEHVELTDSPAKSTRKSSRTHNSNKNLIVSHTRPTKSKRKVCASDTRPKRSKKLQKLPSGTIYKVSCQNCQHEFTTKISGSNVHLTQYTRDGIMICCSKCGQRCLSTITLCPSETSEAPEINVNSSLFVCQYTNCSTKMFTSVQGLSSHMSLHHNLGESRETTVKKEPEHESRHHGKIKKENYDINHENLTDPETNPESDMDLKSDSDSDSKLLQCKYSSCRKQFKQSGRLKKHETCHEPGGVGCFCSGCVLSSNRGNETVSGPRTYGLRCSFCNKSYAVISKRKSSWRKEFEACGVDILCLDCNKVSRSELVVMSDDTNAKNLQSPLFPCSDQNCKLGPFESISAMTKHALCHSTEAVPCPYCNEEVRNKISLKHHWHKCRGRQNPCHCHICNKPQRNEFHLSVHMRRAHNKTSANLCEDCGASFSNRANLKRHLQKTHKKKEHEEALSELYQCNLCDKVFISKEHYQHHKYRSHRPKDKVCGDCGKTFRMAVQLSRHKLTHDSHKDERKHVCKEPDCSEKFVGRRELLEHVRRVHEGERDVCEICSKSFKSLLGYRQHMTTHSNTPKQTFPCEKCSKIFKSRLGLKLHEKKCNGNQTMMTVVTIEDSEETKPPVCVKCQEPFISETSEIADICQSLNSPNIIFVHSHCLTSDGNEDNNYSISTFNVIEKVDLVSP